MVLVGLVGLVLIWLCQGLGRARLWCEQLVAACHGLDIVVVLLRLVVTLDKIEDFRLDNLIEGSQTLRLE